MKISGHALISLSAMVVATALLGRTASLADEPAARAAGAQPREGTVKANGITIAYEDFGPEDHEAVLLIMGNGTQLTAWPIELIEELVSGATGSSSTTIATSAFRPSSTRRGCPM